jgi:hypothetical protein
MNLKSLLISTSFVSLVFAGCAVDSAETAPGGDPVTEERHALGKADNVGSCQAGPFELCGGKGTGTCWCDELCHDFGDCCSDKVDTCGGGEEPACDLPPDKDAYYVGDAQECTVIYFVCDEGYEYFGNPCGCGCIESDAAPEPQGCGGFAGLTCDDGEYCQYEADAMCGAADQMGTCQPQPEACIEIYAPVCGCDGTTYGNGCMAAGAGTSVAHDGACKPAPPPPPPGPCGGCGEGSECQYCWGSFQCVPEGALC